MAVLVLGCGAAASRAGDAAEPVLDADDWASEWRRLALPDPSHSRLGITRTPSGWLLVASVSGEFYAYRSSDGVRWARLRLPEDGVRLTGVAYGGGRYVMVGSRGGPAT